MHAQRLTRSAHLLRGLAGQRGQPRVGEAHLLEIAQRRGLGRQAGVAHGLLHCDDGFDLAQEPGIVFGDRLNLRHRKAQAHRLRR